MTKVDKNEKPSIKLKCSFEFGSSQPQVCDMVGRFKRDFDSVLEIESEADCGVHSIIGYRTPFTFKRGGETYISGEVVWFLYNIAEFDSYRNISIEADGVEGDVLEVAEQIFTEGDRGVELKDVFLDILKELGSDSGSSVNRYIYIQKIVLKEGSVTTEDEFQNIHRLVLDSFINDSLFKKNQVSAFFALPHESELRGLPFFNGRDEAECALLIREYYSKLGGELVCDGEICDEDLGFDYDEDGTAVWIKPRPISGKEKIEADRRNSQRKDDKNKEKLSAVLNTLNCVISSAKCFVAEDVDDESYVISLSEEFSNIGIYAPSYLAREAHINNPTDFFSFLTPELLKLGVSPDFGFEWDHADESLFDLHLERIEVTDYASVNSMIELRSDLGVDHDPQNGIIGEISLSPTEVKAWIYINIKKDMLDLVDQSDCINIIFQARNQLSMIYNKLVETAISKKSLPPNGRGVTSI